MQARAVRQPSPWAWPLLGLAAVATVAVVYPGRLQGRWLAITPLLVAAGILALRRLWSMHPAPTMCAGLALSVFSGAWREIGLGGLPLDRVLLLLVLAQFLLRAPGVANVPRLRARNIHLALALLTIYAFASAAVAGTLTSESGLLSLLDQIGLIPFLMFLLAPAVFSGRPERDLLLKTLVGLGGYLGLMAIFESIGPHGLVFPRYILNLDTALSGEARAGGPFKAVIAEGFSTFACAVAATMAFLQWQGRRRYLAAVVTVLCLTAAGLTLERGVWLGVIAASLLAALVTRSGRRRLAPVALVCTLAIAGLLALSPTLAEHVSNRTDDQTTVWDRQNEISTGLRMLAAKPVLGFGWDRFTLDDLDYFRQAPTYPMVGYSLSNYEEVGKLLPLHETYLSYAVELGLLGALLWLGTLLWGMGESIFTLGPPSLRAWKVGLVAVCVCFLVIALFNPYQSAFPVLLLWVWAGVARGTGGELESL